MDRSPAVTAATLLLDRGGTTGHLYLPGTYTRGTRVVVNRCFFLIVYLKIQLIKWYRTVNIF